MILVKRLISEKLAKYLKLFPVVVIVGPRQSGKTTFAKMELPEWRYFDMEKPSDYGRVSADIEFFLNQYGEHCIIDEAQILPELFPALRNFIDQERTKKGRIVLLGSVNPLLVKNISETLAGRIGFIEIYPFSYPEANVLRKIGLEEFWLHGGYPEPLLWNEKDRFIWMEQYVKTFVERDVFNLLKTSFEALRTSPYRGFSFEGLVIEQLKRKYMQESSDRASFYFYRTLQGDEIDFLVHDGKGLQAYEIKTSTTIDSRDLKQCFQGNELMKNNNPIKPVSS